MTPTQNARGQILVTDDDADVRWVLGSTLGALSRVFGQWGTERSSK